jgi:hypothetical protein
MAHEPSRNVLARAALYRGVDKEEAMTQPTHSTSSTPAMAQHPAMLAIDNARTRMLEALRLLHERSVELERAALEAPARDAGREGARKGEPLCLGCGKGFAPRTGMYTDGVEGPFHAECIPGSQLIRRGPLPTPTEPPPPAWDALTFLKSVGYTPCGPNSMLEEVANLAFAKGCAVTAAEYIVKNRNAAGQRAAGVQVPEEMPEWFPELLNKFMWCNSPFANFGIDEPGFYAALRTRLTQTREG